MIKSSFLVLFTINSYLFSHEYIEHHPLVEPPPKNRTIIKTDSSSIEIKYYEDLNSIREFNELDSSQCFYTDYNFLTKKVRKQGMFKDGYCSGTWKYYDEKGKMEKEINFDTGEKKLFGGKTEPYDQLFIQMKSKADSLLINHFGLSFFYNHIKWNTNNSYYFSFNSSGVWFDIPKEKPVRFKFSYFVLLDSNYKLSSIEFTLDETGKLIDEKESKGLKKCISAPCAFSIDYTKAIQIAKQNGLEQSGNPEHFYLEWNKSPDSYLGDYQLVILALKEKKQFNKRVSYYYYEGIILNPWNGKVIRKSEFYMMYSQTIHCSYSSGILERKDKGILKETFELIYNQAGSIL